MREVSKWAAKNEVFKIETLPLENFVFNF